MKVLYLTESSAVDYQNDCLLIGLRELLGPDLVDVHKRDFAYSSYDEEKAKSLYGMGFSVTRVLDDIKIDRDDIENKIKNRYFDYVVYGSIHRCYDHFGIVAKHYKKHKIIAVDGEDTWHPFSGIRNFGVLYFRRELDFDDTRVFPISFSFPTSKVDFKKIKSKDRAFIDPRDRSTYIYKNEKDYYQDYRDARFAVTMKKFGWDCMRHYEILANGCLPVFLGIENCPIQTMTSFPKSLCVELNARLAHGDLVGVYEEYADKFEKHFLENNTTKAEAKKFMDAVIKANK